MLKLILSIILVVVSIVLIVIVLLQEGKSAGLTSTITGSSDTYWSKNKGRSVEGAVEKSTKFLALAFMVLAIVLSMGFLQ
ncbi:preprotein translocase subunit SecG [Parasporobacterium paucivorans DSM 15970]|uniref:Protein-export membrane protein SecG n=1 Tax=Parasporobacterium paucivorans DSM 15970 TaxID=1122934 RepID=A0A1M6DMK7_9FIRM|nr:preprotein translocase subunit SecG [Parasporobacterium paucivorans]SHI74425.1 preprotein translocase subunit SecG [Parasporobacterium paucivorans DSM 15970]